MTIFVNNITLKTTRSPKKFLRDLIEGHSLFISEKLKYFTKHNLTLLFHVFQSFCLVYQQNTHAHK